MVAPVSMKQSRIGQYQTTTKATINESIIRLLKWEVNYTRVNSIKKQIDWITLDIRNIVSLTLGRYFSGILIELHAFSFTETYLKRSSAKWQPFCPGRDDLTFLNHALSLACATQCTQYINSSPAQQCFYQLPPEHSQQISMKIVQMSGYSSAEENRLSACHDS